MAGDPDTLGPTAVPGAIPWYKSQVLWGIIVSAVFKIAAMLAPKWYPMIAGHEADAVRLVLGLVSLVGDAVAAHGRVSSSAQPVTLTQGSADAEVARQDATK